MIAQTEMPEVLIGPAGGDHVSIQVMGRMHPGADDYWDGNWLISPFEVVAGGFRAEIGAGLRAEELKNFRTELEVMEASLKGKAVLDSMEGWLKLQIVIERLGTLRVTGTALDRPGDGNELSFSIDELDQTYLRQVIASLLRVEVVFPVLAADQVLAHP